MTRPTHPEMVAGLVKPGEEIKASLTFTSWPILRNAVGGMITAGNHLDAVKKQVVYNKPMGFQSSPCRIIPAMSGTQMHLLHMAIGIAGEAAELLEAVANSIILSEPLDMVNVVEELGDLEFYAEGLRQPLGINREETLEANIDKLGARYKGFNYTDKAAQDRADKVEPAATDAA